MRCPYYDAGHPCQDPDCLPCSDYWASLTPAPQDSEDGLDFSRWDGTDPASGCAVAGLLLFAVVVLAGLFALAFACRWGN